MTTETPAFIDALPYIDTAIDDDEEQRNVAMKMVDDEMDLFPPQGDYLDYLPSVISSERPYRTFETPLIQHEHQRIEVNQPGSDGCNRLEQMRTEIPPPASSAGQMEPEELAIWSKCLDQLKIKIEYRQRQMLNLDLLKCYGLPAWEQFIAEHEGMELALKEELDELAKRTQEVNWSRSREQERVLKTLEVLKNEWNSLMDKNRIISDEIRKIRSQIQ